MRGRIAQSIAAAAGLQSALERAITVTEVLNLAVSRTVIQVSGAHDSSCCTGIMMGYTVQLNEGSQQSAPEHAMNRGLTRAWQHTTTHTGLPVCIL